MIYLLFSQRNNTHRASLLSGYLLAPVDIYLSSSGTCIAGASAMLDSYKTTNKEELI
jgi:hypothetical protein